MYDPRYGNNPFLPPLPVGGPGDMPGSSLIVGGDLHFTTHVHGNNQFAQNPMGNVMLQQQMTLMQQAMVQNQVLLEEQRRLQEELTQNSVKRLKAYSNDIRQLLTELATDKGDIPTTPLIDNIPDKTIHLGKPQGVIDAPFEIIKEEEPNKVKKETKDKGEEILDNIEIKELEIYEAIQKSLTKQINSDDEPPYYVKLNIDSNDNKAELPVIFAVRNDCWRKKVRFVLREMYKGVKPSSILTVLYNGEKEAVEIIMITKMAIDEYTGNYDTFEKCILNTNISLYRKQIVLVCKDIGISSLRHFYVLFEPEIDNNTPMLLTNNEDGHYLADHIKIMPVFTSVREVQRICIDLYQRSVILYNI
jgi:hypothetical protein